MHKLLSASFLLLLGAAPLHAQEFEPQWLWGTSDPAEAPSTWFFRTLELPSAAASAELWCSADNVFELWIDGRRVAGHDAWETAVQRDISEYLERAGELSIAVRARNQGGPAGFWFELNLELEDGSKRRLVSDSSWRCALTEPEGWKQAEFRLANGAPPVLLGELGCDPWGPPQGFVDGLPPQVLAGDALEVPPGFTAELVYVVPRHEQGSWVSLCALPDGALLASDQYGSIYRVEPSALGEGERGTRVRRLPLEVGQAQGMCWAFDALYFVGGTGGAGSGLYRATDSDDDGELDQVELLRELQGGGEHGPHAVRLSPEGDSLYIIAGNHTKLPELAGSRVPRHWAEDQLLERAPDARGHAAGILAPGGWLCEVSPDGDEWTLVAMGMRNAYDFDIDAHGELFTFDSDMEWDVGLPWYRPTRVLHLVPGADYGWRHGSGKFPASYPDTWPAVCNVGLGSPTGVLFTPASFPPQWRGRLLVADWAYGTVHAITLHEGGATFTGVAEPFLSGKPLPVTDLETGADGAVYVTTGGRRTQSALYRVVWTGGDEERELSDPRPALPEPHRALRLLLEDPETPLRQSVDALFEGLRADDAWLRRSARVALEELPVDSWREMALAAVGTEARLQALVALARCGERSDRPALAQAIADFPFETLDARQRVAVLRLYALTSTRLGPLLERERDVLRARFDPFYPSGEPALDRELLPVLVSLETPSCVERALELAETATRQEDAIAALFPLRVLERGWTLENRRRYFSALRVAIENFSGGASLRAYLEQARDRALGTMAVEDLDVVADLLEPETRAALGQPIPASFVRTWSVADLEAELAIDWTARDRARGQQLYEVVTCAQCHRFDGEGGNTGPDLTGVGNRFSPRDLLESIVNPSLEISSQYVQTEIFTTDDELFVGRIEEENDEELWLRTLPPEEELYGFGLDEIAERRPHAVSRMPSNLVDTLDREQVLDMLAYLLAGPQEQETEQR